MFCQHVFIVTYKTILVAESLAGSLSNSQAKISLRCSVLFCLKCNFYLNKFFLMQLIVKHFCWNQNILKICWGSNLKKKIKSIKAQRKLWCKPLKIAIRFRTFEILLKLWKSDFYSELCETSKMELLRKLLRLLAKVNCFCESSILGIWLISEYVSAECRKKSPDQKYQISQALESLFVFEKPVKPKIVMGQFME